MQSMRKHLILRSSAQKPVKCKKVLSGTSLLNLKGVNRNLNKEFRKAFLDNPLLILPTESNIIKQAGTAVL